MKKILLVEDDPELSGSISSYLSQNGFQVNYVFDGQMALRAFSTDEFDLVLLDLNLPRINGFDLGRKIRELNSNIPVIIITAFGDIDSKMEAFNAGADDYLVKPFHLRELLAKIRVFLKRAETSPVNEDDIVIADLRIDPRKYTVERAGTAIELTRKEFDLLYYLAKNRNRVVSKDEIASNVWDADFGVSNNAIEVYISFLRNKVDRNFDVKRIKTKPGFGYFMED